MTQPGAAPLSRKILQKERLNPMADRKRSVSKAQMEVLRRMCESNVLGLPRYSEWKPLNRRFWFTAPDGSVKFYGHSTYAPLNRDGYIHLKAEYISGLDYWAHITPAGRALVEVSRGQK